MEATRINGSADNPPHKVTRSFEAYSEYFAGTPGTGAFTAVESHFEDIHSDTLKKPAGFEAEKLIVLPDYLLDDYGKHPLVRPLFITDIGFFPRARYHYRERPEGCDSHIFIFCEEGEGWIELHDGKKLRIQKHMLAVIPAGTPHVYGASNDDPWSIHWFHLKGDQSADFIRCLDLPAAPLSIPIGDFLRTVELLNQICELLLGKPYSLPHMIHISQTIRYLLSSLTLIPGRSRLEDKRRVHLDAALRYMNERLHTSIALPDLAEHVHLSRQHLIALFKQATSFPPIDYFLRLKMMQACRMLDLTTKTVKEIGDTLGIADPYYFSRLFKKIIGQSPTEYRSVQKG